MSRSRSVPFVLLAVVLAVGATSTPALSGLAGVTVDPGTGATQVFPRAVRGGLDECREVDELDGPACGLAPVTCLDATPLGICLRQGFLFRLTMCARANENAHEGHRFSWSAKTDLPPSLELRDPPSVNTNPDSTSTAYMGGDIQIDPQPPSHNGKFFGLVTGEFCGPVEFQATDLCATTMDHLGCSASFPAVIRAMAMPNPALPFPDFVTTTLPAGLLGVMYDEMLEGSGGTGSYLFEVTDGELPNGVSLDPDGTLSGIATEAGKFTFTVELSEDPDAPIFDHDEACAEAPTCPPLTVEFEFMLRILVPPTSTTTLSSTTTTTSSTTTSSTVPVCPFPTEKCGRPINPLEDKPKAGDCLYILRAAVGSKACCLCPCDVDSNKKVNASDALACLKNSVGLPTEIGCDECPPD